MARRTKKNSEMLSKARLKMVASVWDNRTIDIGWRWAAGKTHLSRPTRGLQPGRFRLIPKTLRTSSGKVTVQYKVKFYYKEMPEGWRDLMLTPLGHTAPPVAPLSIPEWDNTVATERKIQRALLALFREMGKPATDVRRLEAFYPVPSGSGYAIDVVRLVHLPRALENGKDVVAVYFNYYQDGVVGAQNGGGSGPPH